MGLVIDLIDKRKLTLGQLVMDIALLVLAALAMYGLVLFGDAIFLGRPISWLGSCVTVCLSNLRSCLRLFIRVIGQGYLMAHATNDINAVTMFAGGGVMSAVDASVTALVTLVSMIFHD